MGGINVSRTERTVAELLKDLERLEVTINTEYQRNPGIWPEHAQAFFIETILLDYPIPKLSLHATTNIKTRQTLKEIVDGQQRTMAIQRFAKDELRLRKKSEIDDAGGRIFSELSDDLKERFLGYRLPIDEFVGAGPGEVRQIFRRINSYTAPLSPEEKRHAEFQGEMKFLVLDVTRRYGEVLREIGVFTERQLVRMLDARLVTEIVDAITSGIRTTKAADLRDVYKRFNSEFPDSERFLAGFDEAMARIVKWPAIHKSELTKPHAFGSLICALLHASQGWAGLEGVAPGSRGLRAAPEVLRRLGELETAAACSSEGEVENEYRLFWKANESQTNVKAHREARFQYLLRAISPVDR